VKGHAVLGLKTDLWNEGVETNRCVVGTLEERYDFLSMVGIDISRPNCQQAKDRLRRTDIINADIRALPFARENFDMIFDVSTIDHVPPTEAQEVLDEYWRVLKKSGMFLVIFWYAGGLLSLSHKLHKPSEFERAPYRYYFPVKAIEASMRGFQLLDKFWMLGWGGGAVSRTGKSGGRKLYGLYLRLAYSRFSPLFKPFGGMCVIVAKKRDV
jgi:SAM-dependent methyltransferase